MPTLPARNAISEHLDDAEAGERLQHPLANSNLERDRGQSLRGRDNRHPAGLAAFAAQDREDASVVELLVRILHRGPVRRIAVAEADQLCRLGARQPSEGTEHIIANAVDNAVDNAVTDAAPGVHP